VDTAFAIFIVILFLCLSVGLLFGLFLIGQYVIERFIQVTLPILVELYGRIRYPYAFKDK
jgi:hypothetical protein